MRLIVSALLTAGVSCNDFYPNFDVAADAAYVQPQVNVVLSSPHVGKGLPSQLPVYFHHPVSPSDVTVTIAPSHAACRLQWHSDTHASLHTHCAAAMRGTRQTYQVSVDVDGEEWTEELLVIDAKPRPWPFTNPPSSEWPPRQPNLVGNIMENYQSFSGAAAAYVHQGLDIRSEDLQDIHSPTAGRVVRIVNYRSGNPLYWSLMVQDDDGFVWQFHHVDESTYTVSEGDQVREGDVLGKICTWPAQHNGVLYHHVHMNVAWPHESWDTITEPYIDGWKYYNPMNFLEKLTDNLQETPFSDEVFFFHPNGQPNDVYTSTEEREPIVSGDTDIVTNLHSWFEETNNLGGHPYNNGLYHISYAVDPAPGCGEHCNAIPETVLATFDSFPGDWPYNQPGYERWRNDEMLRRIYCQSFRYQGQRYQSVFTYQQRQLYYTVTNSFAGQPDAEQGFWDTSVSGNGAHDVTVFAEDWYGRALNITHRVTVSN